MDTHIVLPPPDRERLEDLAGRARTNPSRAIRVALQLAEDASDAELRCAAAELPDVRRRREAATAA